MRLATLTLFATVLAQPVWAQQLEGDRITVQSCNQIHMDAHAAAAAGEISSQEYEQLWQFGNLCTAIALGRQWAGDDYQYFTVLQARFRDGSVVIHELWYSRVPMPKS